MSKLRVAFVGIHVHAGDLNPQRIQPGYLHTFKNIPDVEVVAYCVNPENAPPGSGDHAILEALRQHEKSAAFYESVDDLIRGTQFDLAVVLMPPRDIPAVSVKLLDAKKHIFCEKQFALNSFEFRPVVEAVQRNNRAFYAAYPWRRHPVASHLQELIGDGALGEPMSLNISFTTWQVREGLRNPQDWPYRVKTQGGGILHYLGSHFLDVARSLMDCEVSVVSSICARPLGEIEADLEDVGSVSLQWENGALGTFHAGYLIPPGLPGGTSVVYYGSEGIAEWRPGSNPERLVVHSTKWPSAKKRVFEFELQPRALVYGNSEWIFQTCLEAVEAIRRGERPPVTEVDALKVLEMIDAAYQSSRQGRAVSIRDLTSSNTLA